MEVCIRLWELIALLRKKLLKMKEKEGFKRRGWIKKAYRKNENKPGISAAYGRKI